MRPSWSTSASRKMESMTSAGKSLPRSSSLTIDTISSLVMKPSPSWQCSSRRPVADLVEDLKARLQLIVGVVLDGRRCHVLDELLERDLAVA